MARKCNFCVCVCVTKHDYERDGGGWEWWEMFQGCSFIILGSLRQIESLEIWCYINKASCVWVYVTSEGILEFTLNNLSKRINHYSPNVDLRIWMIILHFSLLIFALLDWSLKGAGGLNESLLPHLDFIGCSLQRAVCDHEHWPLSGSVSSEVSAVNIWT